MDYSVWWLILFQGFSQQLASMIQQVLFELLLYLIDQLYGYKLKHYSKLGRSELKLLQTCDWSSGYTVNRGEVIKLGWMFKYCSKTKQWWLAYLSENELIYNGYLLANLEFHAQIYRSSFTGTIELSNSISVFTVAGLYRWEIQEFSLTKQRVHIKPNLIQQLILDELATLSHTECRTILLMGASGVGKTTCSELFTYQHESASLVKYVKLEEMLRKPASLSILTNTCNNSSSRNNCHCVLCFNEIETTLKPLMASAETASTMFPGVTSPADAAVAIMNLKRDWNDLLDDLSQIIETTTFMTSNLTFEDFQHHPNLKIAVRPGRFARLFDISLIEGTKYKIDIYRPDRQNWQICSKFVE